MSKIFDKLLEKRGISSDFLNPKYLSDPNIHEKLPDIEVALDKIEEAISKKQKIMVYGDYDVDGVTATTVMAKSLELAGAEDVITMLPDRFIDGYGMSERCIDRAKAEEVSLIITVDCGSNNSEVISKLNQTGIKTVVTDHHEIMGDLPKAEAVVNPKRGDNSELSDLAGVGVAFLVARGLVKRGLIPDGQEKWLLDLVLIGTLCDSMNISQLNRELTFYGLKVLAKTRRPGLKELMRVAGTTKLNSEAIGFQIGPRLNAGGRIKSAEISLKLLMTNSKAEATELAEELNQLNQARRNEQMEAVKEISSKDFSKASVIVVSGEWHEGVLGIIAGRLVEKYQKPAFVLSKVKVKDEDGDGFLDIYKGSGRSFGEFNLAKALKICSDDIIGGGGHAGACGLSVSVEKIESFKASVNKYYKSLKLKNQEKFLKAEPEITTDNASELSVELLDELSKLEPFGEGNQEPKFKLEKMKVIEVRKVGKDENHLRLVVEDKKGNRFTSISFNSPKEWLEIKPDETLDLVISLTRNEWNGRVSSEGYILDII